MLHPATTVAPTMKLDETLSAEAGTTMAQATSKPVADRDQTYPRVAP